MAFSVVTKKTTIPVAGSAALKDIQDWKLEIHLKNIFEVSALRLQAAICSSFMQRACLCCLQQLQDRQAKSDDEEAKAEHLEASVAYVADALYDLRQAGRHRLAPWHFSSKPLTLTPLSPPSLPDVLQLVLCLLAPLLQGLWAAPLPEFSGAYGYLSGDQGFQQFLTSNLEFSLKIKAGAEKLREVFCQDYRLCNEQELSLVRRQLKISQAPLDQCQSTNFNLDSCFTQIRNGLQMYHTDFSVVQQHLPANSVAIGRLVLDISDFASNFQQQMETMGIAVVSYPGLTGQDLSFPTTFHEQAGGYLLLSNLQHFLETVFRALRFLQKQ
ncbi:granulocyte colony-stimulating factor [Rhinatrema bivittatum]|uniref:granulocyte colony-stimulating factor n=1 Tax=Rhinatrema bivittatum TaxID=194408 RepID=UPI00112E91C0|nr:granulocyte colony-stimulating factor [Rhinatrema bivittatum]